MKATGTVLRIDDLGRCEVCGHTMNKQILRPWNGKKVCRPCISQLEDETDRYFSAVKSH